MDWILRLTTLLNSNVQFLTHKKNAQETRNKQRNKVQLIQREKISQQKLLLKENDSDFTKKITFKQVFKDAEKAQGNDIWAN